MRLNSARREMERRARMSPVKPSASLLRSADSKCGSLILRWRVQPCFLCPLQQRGGELLCEIPKVRLARFKCKLIEKRLRLFELRVGTFHFLCRQRAYVINVAFDWRQRLDSGVAHSGSL